MKRSFKCLMTSAIVIKKESTTGSSNKRTKLCTEIVYIILQLSVRLF